MLRNNNRPVISRMARQFLKRNGKKTGIMVIAVFLAAFMLVTVLTVGMTYLKMQKIQNIRLNGGVFDAIMYGLTEEQQKKCENDPDIQLTGIVAVCGYAVETEQDQTPNAGFIWADDNYWNVIKKPAVEWVKGKYPTEENEVMVSEEALEACGLKGLSIGDSFSMKYSDAKGTYTKEFRISGMWEGYGDKKVFYMSRAYFDQSGYSLYDVASARYFMDFKQTFMSQKEQDAFVENMHLEKQQSLFFVSDYSKAIEITAGLAGIVLITCFCAYLLIYNILYLSVSGNIRYYGLLQTVGMTGRQIYRFMYRQMFFVGMTGIAAGLLAGGGVSFFLIPSIVKSLGIHEVDVKVTFHPGVFLLAMAITAFTVCIGSRKPAKMAVEVSPVEAMGYRMATGRNSRKKTGKGRLIWRMAGEQFVKDKKKTVIVVLSLAVSLSVFLCLVTLLKSQAARTIIGNYQDMDLVVKNDTLTREERTDWTQILDESLIEKMRHTDGVESVDPVWTGEIIVPWEPEVTDVWMREHYAMWRRGAYEDEVTEYQEHPENFGSFMVGIGEEDFDALNETLQSPADKEDFLSGKTCIVYRNRLDFKDSDLRGKELTCAEYADPGNSRTFEIAGLTDESCYTGALIGEPPTMIVSDRVLKEFLPDVYTSKVGIRYGESYDEETEKQLLKLEHESPHAQDFSNDSKLEMLKDIERAQGNLMEVGMGIVLILALIGGMNYINTVTGNIQNRQTELAILESVGMTERQVNQMLAAEGAFFAAASLSVTATVGMGVTYYLYQSMNYMETPFSVPVLPVIAMGSMVVLICVFVPLAVRKLAARKNTVAERIRGME